jgi:hypothetical protein
VVLISSRLGLFCVTRARSGSKCRHPRESRFFQRYARKLPSSLTRDHSSTLAYSASLPVSVCGTGRCLLPSRPFSTAQVPRPRGVCCHTRSLSPLGQREQDLLCSLPTSLDGARLAAALPPQLPALVKRKPPVLECLPVVHRWSPSRAPLRPD